MSGGADLSVPLYQGGTVKNSVKAATTRVEAGRADLAAVEGDIFTEAVAAYMDVVLTAQSCRAERESGRRAPFDKATRSRFEIEDLTRTDVAQST